MDWIKRNLVFVIGATIALLLMVGAGYYTWTGYSNHATADEELTAKYEELKRLSGLDLNPGKGNVDNIKATRTQEQTVRQMFAQAKRHFEPIPAIPEGGTNVTAEAFANSLSRIITILRQEASNASVVLTTNYAFSFQQQSRIMKFAPGSVAPLSVQLGEVKALADVLIAAKVNYLDTIQRERVSADDNLGPQTDYLDFKSQTNANELAVVTPYQLTFRCFTPELAQVLCGFASSPHGLVVKSFNVELAPITVVETPQAPPVYYQPAPTAAAPRRDPLAERYGLAGRYGGMGGPGGMGGRDGYMRPPPPAYTPPPVAAPVVAAPPPAAPRLVLNEKQLKITMLVEVVKLLPPKNSGRGTE